MLKLPIFTILLILTGCPTEDHGARHRRENAWARQTWLSDCVQHRPLDECRVDYDEVWPDGRWGRRTP